MEKRWRGSGCEARIPLPEGQGSWASSWLRRLLPFPGKPVPFWISSLTVLLSLSPLRTAFCWLRERPLPLPFPWPSWRESTHTRRGGPGGSSPAPGWCRPQAAGTRGRLLLLFLSPFLPQKSPGDLTTTPGTLMQTARAHGVLALEVPTYLPLALSWPSQPSGHSRSLRPGHSRSLLPSPIRRTGRSPGRCFSHTLRCRWHCRPRF